MIFITDELGKFEKNIIELAENVGFKECKTIEAIDLFCGISEKNDVLKEKDRYYAFIDIPQYWSVRADGLNGAIYDNKTKKANIYFKNPIEKRMVSRVEWIDRNNTVYRIDYYNKYGYMYCSENVSGGNVTVREFYDRNGDIKVLEQTGPKTYTTFGTRISPKSYRGFADYLEAYLKYNKIYDENIWLTSDEILNKFAWDYGNFKISYLPQNRLNSDLTVITQTNTAFRILCSEEQQVNWYKGQGMLAVCCAVVITTFIIDIIKHRTLGYRPEMVAMIIALVLVLIEAASVYFVVTMSGFFIGTGLIVILFVNIIVTIKRISEIEYKRQKEESDRLRNQTERVSLQMMKTLAATIEAKDDYMRGHSYRVAEYSALIAKQLGWSEHEVENLRNAAYLHDIGKIGVPDTILNKPTRLTDEEFAAIKSHTVMGADILKDITLLDHLVDIARNHHERYDGKGYPDGLVGEEIPLSARIVCVADSYDAMKSRRIYRNALPDEEIRRELLDNCGTQFDPQISRMFVDMLDNGMVVIDEDNPAAQGYRDNAAIESVADKFISEVMKTMSSQEKADSVDYLTGLYMRSRGQQVIAALMQDNDGCLAFIDMDNLKKVNDVHGHKAGDRALKLIGNLLAKETENETFAACRLGGDEFLIFMPYSDRASVESVIKRIFEGFESAREADCEIKEAALSAGLCMTTKGAMFESDYTKADKALYYVKQNCKGSYFFYEQLLADNKENTNLSADLRNVAKLLKESGSYTGALDLNYREFARIYEFVNNVGDRHNHNCYLVMVTMNTLPEQLADIEEIEKALDCMEQSIRSKIRKVDVCTRYSSMQYLIILFEPQENQIPNVMERIFMHYYELCDRENFKPQYEYIKMTEVK